MWYFVCSCVESPAGSPGLATGHWRTRVVLLVWLNENDVRMTSPSWTSLSCTHVCMGDPLARCVRVARGGNEAGQGAALLNTVAAESSSEGADAPADDLHA